MSFDPSKLQQQPTSSGRRAPPSERLFVQVDHYETPSDSFHFAIGTRIDTGEQVRVRLNTVKERMEDRPGSNAEAVKALYVSGENTRDSLDDKARNGVKLLSFDDTKKIGQSADGVAEYRAHWPKTMATDPSAETRVGLMQVVLRDATEHNGEHHKPKARVDQLQWSVRADRDNVDEALSRGLAIKDEAGRARDPFVQIRVFHEGQVVQNVRLYPDREAKKVFDQVEGEYKEQNRPVDADRTIAALLSGAKGWNADDNARKDVARALIAGVKGLEEPVFNSADDAVRSRARNLYHGTAQGALTVEITAGEGIDFGAKARQSYLSKSDSFPMNAYVDKQKVGEGDSKYERITGLYAETVIAVNRHPDGEPYAVFASPVAMFPKVAKLEALPELPAGVPDWALDIAARKDKDAERAAEAAACEM